jgi:hypothetical protein
VLALSAAAQTFREGPDLEEQTPTLTQGASVWHVDAAGTPPGNGTLQDPFTAIQAALSNPSLAPGDHVVVAPGVYPGPLDGPPFGIVLRSTHGAALTVVDGLGEDPALRLRGSDGMPFVVDGFTLENGQGSPVNPIFSAGGGLQAVDACFVLEDCVVQHNDAFWGGGVMAKNSVGEIRGSRIEDNTNTGFGGRGAGVLVDGGSLWIQSSSIRANASGDFFAPGNGGGIYAQGAVELDVVDTLIEQNVAELGGGGVYGPGEYLDCELRENRGQFGGGINAGSSTSFTNCLIEANVADSVGGTSHFGGGAWGSATFQSCTIRANVAWGGAAGVDGGLLLQCAVEENLALPGYGGVNEITGGAARAVVLDSLLARNTADGAELYFARGGGVAQATVIDCDLDANVARPEPDARGGGAYDCELRRSRLYDNTVMGAGGGAFGGTLLRCLAFENRAVAGGGAADAELEHCTLEGNQAQVGDGLWASQTADIAVANSILYGNGSEEIAVEPGAVFQVTFSDVLGGFPGVGNIDADPRFYAPQANDYHLLPTSPCIDAGDPSWPPDPDGSTTDMGALRADPDYHIHKDSSNLVHKP